MGKLINMLVFLSMIAFFWRQTWAYPLGFVLPVFLGVCGCVYWVSRPSIRSAAIRERPPRRLRFTIGHLMVATLLAGILAAIARLVVAAILAGEARRMPIAVGWPSAAKATVAVIAAYLALGLLAYFCWSIFTLFRGVPKKVREED